VVLVVVRPLVRRIVEPDKIAMAAQALAKLTSADASANGTEPQQAAVTCSSKMLEYAKIQGKVQAEAIKHVGELAEHNPQETTAIIREWLAESAAT